ncbi:MAG: type 1 glutamine amidotransferase [Gemmatimonadota bacterium]|nr:type 1 glutamine amidotransferase [Gemmatimonadota bacterium]
MSQAMGEADRRRAHVLLHAPFEGPGSIEPWLHARGWEITRTHLFAAEELPTVADIDLLCIMGGPMSVNDEGAYRWLAPEKDFVARAIASSKVVLGICLGAQVIASALGARVSENPEPEIGWFPVEPATGAGESSFSWFFGETREAFHWHGEKCELPAGAVHLARSAACEHQAFAVGDRVLGLQFHLETTVEGARALVENCRADLSRAPGRWVQGENELLEDATRFARANEAMASLLDDMASLAG